jgi:hypothetical protein
LVQILKPVLLLVLKALLLLKVLEEEGLFLELMEVVGCHSLHHRRKEMVMEGGYHQKNLRENQGERPSERKKNLGGEVKLLLPELILLQLLEVVEELNRQAVVEGLIRYIHLQMMAEGVRPHR